MSTPQRQADSDIWFDQTSGEFDIFVQQLARKTSADEVPQATDIQRTSRSMAAITFAQSRLNLPGAARYLPNGPMFLPMVRGS